MMTSSPACTPQVKRGTMPTLGNNNIRTNNKEQVKHIVFSDRGSSSKLASGTNSVKTNNVAIKPFVPTAKLTLDGKVVDIDVLTKLQQQNGGNIVSFTASKEFLSNLASAKIHSSKISGTSKSRVNKQDVSVFKSLTGKRTQQEKVLLPKNQLNGFTPKSRIEVKKFAPEIKGLLSGLSTAFKTSTAVSINTTKCSRDIQSGGLLQASNASCKGITEQAKRNLLLAVKTTEQITSSTLNTNITSSGTVGNKTSLVSQVSNNRQPQASLKKLSWNSLPQTSSVIVPNSARNIARTQSVITSTGSTKVFPFKTSYNHFELSQSLKHPNQGIEEEKRKRSPTCNVKVKKDSYGYPADFVNKNNTYESQYHSVKNTKEPAKPTHTFRNVSNEVRGDTRLTIKQEAKTSIFENSNGAQKNKSTIAK